MQKTQGDEEKGVNKRLALQIFGVHRKCWHTCDTLRPPFVKACALITYMTVSQQMFSSSNLTKWSILSCRETLEQCLKYVQS